VAAFSLHLLPLAEQPNECRQRGLQKLGRGMGAMPLLDRAGDPFDAFEDLNANRFGIEHLGPEDLELAALSGYRSPNEVVGDAF
jgi:hypothetical protein